LANKTIDFEEFNAQVLLFCDYLSRAFEYPEYVDLQTAKVRMYNANRIIDEDIPLFIEFASYIGTLFRIAYYKYVHKMGFDVRALADASVLVFLFNDVYRFEFEPYLRRKEIKSIIDSTRYPQWTRFGLVGGSTKQLIDMGEEFSRYMDNLKAGEMPDG